MPLRAALMREVALRMYGWFDSGQKKPQLSPLSLFPRLDAHGEPSQRQLQGRSSTGVRLICRRGLTAIAIDVICESSAANRARARTRRRPRGARAAGALGALARGIFPGAVSRMMTLVIRALPSGKRTPTAREARFRYQSESALARSLLTLASERAATRNNER